MGMSSHEEAYGCKSSWHAISHVQKWSILSESNIGYSNEIVRRATSIWKSMMNPHDIDMKDIFNMFLDTILVDTNMKYFKSQQIAMEHGDEEEAIN